MKKIIITMLCILSVFAMVGCDLFGPADKEFSGSGITITLNEDFVLTETVISPFYLVSFDHIFMGMRESKSLVNDYGIDTLTEYIDGVLDNGGHGEEISYSSDETGATYVYAYYTATVDGTDYGYMLICMLSSTYFYSMNFGCLEKNLEDNKTQYHVWADTIVIE
jgi:hypothetical protein